MTQEDLADLLIQRLNAILAIDPLAIQTLFEYRVPCRPALAIHPTVQVIPSPTGPFVGLLGLLNGLVGVIDEDGPQRGLISAYYDEHDDLVCFCWTR